jgi:hypothetical protein
VKKQADREKVKKADREKQKGEKIDSHQKSVKNYDDESFWCLCCAMVLFFYLRLVVVMSSIGYVIVL